MELKRILARDSRAANDKALQLYGPDVLVISSQRVDNQTELIVAIDTPEDAAAGAPKAPHPVVSSREQDRFVAFSDVFKVNMSADADASAFEPEVYEPAAERLAAAQKTAPAATLTPEPMAAAPAAIATAHAYVNTPSSISVSAPVMAAQDVQAEADDLRRSRDTVELLRQEIAALRQEFNLNRQVAMWQTGQGLSPELTGWFAQMQELGVPASLRTLMADAVKDCVTVSAAWPLVHQVLSSAVQRRKAAWPVKGVHALVGPSGAGKSLMVARMAQAAASQISAEEMAIISFADTKAGAWSQLQVLAAQSGVSCYRAADASTLEVLLGELSHHKVIWIDTPGTDFVEHARTLQSMGTPISLHGVLALDATVTNVRKIFDASAPAWKSVMLTKFDEAAHPWPVLKALCDSSLPVTAVGGSHQARVAPLAFEADALVDLALKGLQPEGVAIEMPAVDMPVKKTTRRRTSVAKTKVLNG